jgi:hypothetical protein
MNMSVVEHPDGNHQLSFPEAFSPIAYHLFPDGCPDERLACIWPIRTDRTLVPFPKAKTALIQILRKWDGYDTPQLDSLVLAASHAVSGNCTSPFIRHFKDFLRCLIPKTKDCFLSPHSLRRLMLARLADDDRAYLYRLMILAIRNGVLVETVEQLSTYYPLIFHHCQRLDEAVHLLHLLTNRNHVCPFRAQRLSTWYDQGSIFVYVLLELYSKFDPQGCQKYLPLADDRPRQILRLKSDKAWARELLKYVIGDDDTYNDDLERPMKRLKASWLLTLDRKHTPVWRGQREVRAVLTNEALLQHAALADPCSDGHLIQLRANVPYMLYEDWYLGGDESIIVEKEGDDSDEDDDTELEKRHLPRERPHLLQTRSTIVQALAVFSHHVGSLLPELQTFLLEDIVPSWDGSDEVGLTLCHDLLPHVNRSASHHDKVLRYLEPFVRYGSPRLQYRILAGLVPQWIQKWGNHPETINLVKWASAEMKRAFLGNGGHELLRLATIDLYNAVRVTMTLLPNSTVVYTLLLSRTTVSIDQLCGLLMGYRATLLKTRALLGKRESERLIALFNSYVWDIVSVCWRNSIARHTTSCLFNEISEVVLAAVGKDQQSALSITHSAAFVGYYVAGPRNRAKYVDELRERGLTGLHSFLVTFVGALAEREQRKHL